MFTTLGAIFQKLSTDASVRAIIITGAGDKAFTAGLDVNAASTGSVFSPDASLDVARIANSHRRVILAYQAAASAIAQCEKPTIALLHGYAYGMAVDIATACDVRVCVPNTQFSVKEVDIGLAADVGTLSRLPKVVGSGSWVKEVCLTGRVFGAEEAARVGFVSKVVEGGKKEGLEGAFEIARTIAAKSPVAVVGTKELLDYSRDRTVEDGECLFHGLCGEGANLFACRVEVYSGVECGYAPD